MRPPNRSLVLSAVFLFAFSSWSSPAAAEVVLVPLIIQPPGVFGQNGALWGTDFTMENYGEQPWWQSGVNAHCSFDGFGLLPHTTFNNPFCAPAGGVGALLDIGDDHLIRLQLRVRDVNSETVEHGTEIPIIRGSDALTGASAILDMPSASGFRRTLRVYNISRTESFRFSIKFRPILSDDVVFETTRELLPSRGTFTSVAILNDADIPNLEEYGSLKVEIVPEADDVPYWWFASLAGNSTNQLTIISPQ